MSHTSVSRLSIRSAVAVCLGLTMVSGCYTTQAVRTRVSPEFAAAELAASREDNTAAAMSAVVLDDGSEVEFTEPVTLGGDGMVRGVRLVESSDGRTVTRPVAVSWTRVNEVVLQTGERKIHWGKTLGLALGIPAGAFIVGIILYTEGGGFNGLGEALSPLSSR